MYYFIFNSFVYNVILKGHSKKKKKEKIFLIAFSGN